MDQLTLVIDSFSSAFSILGSYWWIYVPVILAFGVFEAWRNYTRTKYIGSLKWALLEIIPPPDVQKSPKIAENIFSGLHGIYVKSVKFKKQFFEGKVPDWFSFEIVSNGGDMHFYIRTLESNRNLVENQIFSQYPDAEIRMADDYITLLPDSLPDDDYDLFGAELIFTKEDAYPIKTYPFFEEESGKDEFKRTDPLAPLAEIMTSIGPGEHLWLQLLARPTGSAWTEKAQPVIDKIIGKKPKPPEPDIFSKAITGGIEALMPSGEKKEEKKENKDEFNLQKLTPGQKFILEQIEAKIAKLAFKSGYRFLYIAKKDVFSLGRVSTVIGMFKQVYSYNMNTFKPNSEVGTSPDGYLKWLFPSDKGFFAGRQAYERKYSIYKKYRRRAFVKKEVILNTEELATLFHLPGINVKAPSFPRVQAKKGQPPVGLPTG